MDTVTPSRFERLQDSDLLAIELDPYTPRGETYRDHTMTVTRGGKTYPVGTVTEYPDGSFTAFAHHDVTRLKTTRRAWAHVLDVAGISTAREERFKARSVVWSCPE